MVGGAIRGRRDEVFLATKLFPIGLPFQVASRAGASARRLGVDRIDLYQQHWPSPMFPPGATMPRMRKLVESGLVLHVGVSNHSLAQWQAADRSFGGPVLSNQVRFNVLERGPEGDLVPWAHENGRVVIAYSPLAQGLLSGKYLETTPRNLRRLRPAFSASSRARLQPLIRALSEIANMHNASAAQAALAWLIRKPNVVAIRGASGVHQMEQNAAAAGIALRHEEGDGCWGL